MPRDDHEMALAAVLENAYMLLHAGCGSADRELVLAAVKHNGLALEYAATPLAQG